MSSRHLIILATRLAITLAIIHSLGFAALAATAEQKTVTGLCRFQ